MKMHLKKIFLSVCRKWLTVRMCRSSLTPAIASPPFRPNDVRAFVSTSLDRGRWAQCTLSSVGTLVSISSLRIERSTYWSCRGKGWKREGGVSLSATSVEKTWSLKELFEVRNNYVYSLVQRMGRVNNANALFRLKRLWLFHIATKLTLILMF